MPHFPKPFFKKKRRLWYVEIERVQHNLGPDREKAFELYHELMTQARSPERIPEVGPKSVIALIDKYLGWCEKHRAPDTYRWYKGRLLVFIDDGLPGEDLAATALKPFHLQAWIDRMDGITDGTRRNYCRAVQRVFSWAEKLGYIDTSPSDQKTVTDGSKSPVSHDHPLPTADYSSLTARGQLIDCPRNHGQAALGRRLMVECRFRRASKADIKWKMAVLSCRDCPAVGGTTTLN